MCKLLLSCALSVLLVSACGPTEETLELKASTMPDAAVSGTGGSGGKSVAIGGKGGAPLVDAAVPVNVDAPSVVVILDAGALDTYVPANTGGMGGSGGTPDAGAPLPPPPAFATWEFEETAQGWADYGSGLDPNTAPKSLPVSSQTVVNSGKSSLRYLVNGVSGDSRYLALFDTAAIGPLAKYASISFSVWVPSDHKLAYLQAFVLGETVPWAAVDTNMSPLVLGGWKTFVLPIPTSYVAEVPPNGMAIGLQMVLAADWRGFIYLDSVNLKLR